MVSAATSASLFGFLSTSARQVHRDLIESLAEDLQKYRGVRDVSYLEAAFENLRHHYGLRFKYETFVVEDARKDAALRQDEKPRVEQAGLQGLIGSAFCRKIFLPG